MISKDEAIDIGLKVALEMSGNDYECECKKVGSGLIFIKDPTGGTDASLEYFKKHKHELGKITTLSCDKNSKLKIYGNNGTMELSGCTCGYSGQGPRGTQEILESVGFSSEFAEVASHQDKFKIGVM